VNDKNGGGDNAEVTFLATYTLPAAARSNLKVFEVRDGHGASGMDKDSSFEIY
jgi:hypothetical protein